MRYSRMASSPPPRKKSRYANWIIAIVILGIAAYLIGAGAAGGWLAKNVIEPVFGKSPSETSAEATVSATATGTQAASAPSATATGRVEETITAGEISLYTLQVGAFTDESHANTSAAAIAAMGGAGYVAYDGELLPRVRRGVFERKRREGRPVRTRSTGCDLHGIPAQIRHARVQDRRDARPGGGREGVLRRRAGCGPGAAADRIRRRPRQIRRRRNQSALSRRDTRRTTRWKRQYRRTTVQFRALRRICRNFVKK